VTENRIANRYARGLFEEAQHKGLEEKVLQDMQLVQSTLDQNRDLVVVLNSPVISSDKKVPILRRIFASHVQPLSARMMELLTQRQREELLPFMISEYRSLYNQAKNIREVELVSAAELEASHREDIRQKLQQALNSQIVFHEKVNNDLIGGFILQFGDLQFDGSVRNELRRLRRSFDQTNISLN
jgi:F-type H+-transporting ATPase subunit delta